MSLRENLKKLDKVNTAFLFITPLVGFFGTAFLWHYQGIPWQTWAFSVIMAIATGLGITAGYHRLFSHKSYDAKWPVRLFLLIVGAAAFENSARKWSSDHRRHHKFVDTDQDPYNIKRGFFYAHMGWVCLKYSADRDYNDVPDLMRDPLVEFQDKHYLWMGIVAGFLFPMAVASLWGDPFGGLLVAGAARIVINQHFTFFINSWCHMWGKQPYSEKDTSRDSWLPAIFTYGEGYHNYHHTFPSDYRNGVRAYHWDPTKWFIKALEWVGQTSNLRRVPNVTILRAKLEMDEIRILRKLEKSNASALARREFVMSCRKRLEDEIAHFQAIKAEYNKLKNQKLDQIGDQWHHLQEKLEVLKRELQRARENVRGAISEWSRLCGQFGLPKNHLAFSV